MKPHILFPIAAFTLLNASCANFGDALLDSAFEGVTDSIFETREDREIDSDTKRMQAGEPLRHYPSERRLRIAREDRMLNEMMED
jgi:hypothetical protein